MRRLGMCGEGTQEDSGGTYRVLERLPVGGTATVVRIEGSDTVAQRLMAMGVVPGARVRVIRIAPLGDPMLIALNEYHLSLRRSDAAQVCVKSLD